MTKIQAIREIVRLSRDPETMGSAAILKGATFSKPPSPELLTKLAPVRGYLPTVDLAYLKGLPDGTFGREYARSLEVAGLTPITYHPVVKDAAERNPWIVRYVLTHDMFHLLLGFDTSVAGEAGVYTFAAEQGYSPVPSAFLAVARVAFSLLMPWQARRLWQAHRRGRELARQAAFLLAYRFEEHWHEPLAKVRTDLGLPA